MISEQAKLDSLRKKAIVVNLLSVVLCSIFVFFDTMIWPTFVVIVLWTVFLMLPEEKRINLAKNKAAFIIALLVTAVYASGQGFMAFLLTLSLIFARDPDN